MSCDVGSDLDLLFSRFVVIFLITNQKLIMAELLLLSVNRLRKVYQFRTMGIRAELFTKLMASVFPMVKLPLRRQTQLFVSRISVRSNESLRKRFFYGKGFSENLQI